MNQKPFSKIPLRDGGEIHTVGINLFLVRDLDPRQLCLPFFQAVIVAKKQLPNPPVMSEKTFRAKWATVPDECRPLYTHTKDLHQLPLPFHEKRNIGTKESKRVIKADFPAFERTDSGNLCEFPIPKGSAVEFRKWCFENCIGRFMVKQDFAIFMLHDDATIASLFVPTRGHDVL